MDRIRVSDRVFAVETTTSDPGWGARGRRLEPLDRRTGNTELGGREGRRRHHGWHVDRDSHGRQRSRQLTREGTESYARAVMGRRRRIGARGVGVSLGVSPRAGVRAVRVRTRMRGRVGFDVRARVVSTIGIVERESRGHRTHDSRHQERDRTSRQGIRPQHVRTLGHTRASHSREIPDMRAFPPGARRGGRARRGGPSFPASGPVGPRIPYVTRCGPTGPGRVSSGPSAPSDGRTGSPPT